MHPGTLLHTSPQYKTRTDHCLRPIPSSRARVVTLTFFPSFNIQFTLKFHIHITFFIGPSFGLAARSSIPLVSGDMLLYPARTDRGACHGGSLMVWMVYPVPRATRAYFPYSHPLANARISNIALFNVTTRGSSQHAAALSRGAQSAPAGVERPLSIPLLIYLDKRANPSRFNTIKYVMCAPPSMSELKWFEMAEKTYERERERERRVCQSSLHY